MSDEKIDLNEVSKAVEGVNRAFEEFKSTNDTRLKELEAKGAADPILEEKLSRIEADLTRAQEVADQAVLAAKRRERVVTDASGNEVDLDAKALKWAKQIAKERGTDISEYGAEQMAEYKAAFDSYMRKGDRALEANEEKALSVGSDADGGYTVHPDMSGRIVGRVFETSPIRAYASVQTISTDALEGLHDVDEVGFGWVEETGARTSTDTPELKRWRIPVHEMYANPPATQRILDDSEINMEEWLAGKVANKFARAEATAFVSGNGVTQPRGFLTYNDWATAGTFEIGAIEQFDTGANGAFAAAPNGGDVLINALTGLKAEYRANATWAMNRATTGLVRKLKDSDGAYLWMPGIAAGQPATLLGYPTASFEDMPDATGTGALGIAIADWREAYQIVDRAGIRTLRDPYTNKPYVHFYSTKRTGGDVVNFEAIKLIKFAA